MNKYRYRIARRFVQLSILVLFIGSSYWNWNILNGNYSAAYLFETVYLVDPYAVIQILSTGVMLPQSALIGAAIILIIYALIFGRGFCSWVCPVNIISDISFSLRKVFNIPEKENNNFINRNTRYWILGLSIVVSIFTGIAAFEQISPISMLHRGIIFGAGFGWAVVLCILLFDTFIKKHGWCGYLCPLGAFYSSVSRYRLLKVKHDVEKCTNCKDCFMICPEKQVLNIVGEQSGYIDKEGACNNCGRCIEICDDKALKYAIKI